MKTTKYNTGDLLVKRTGKSRILLITDVQFYIHDELTGKDYCTLTMYDMSENTYNCYNSEHCDTWLHSLYKHYRVKQ